MKSIIYTADYCYSMSGNYSHWYPINGENCDSVREAREVALAWIRSHIEAEAYANELCAVASALDAGDEMHIDECAGLNAPHKLRIYAQTIEA